MLQRLRARRLGQVFLTNGSVAQAEAEHAHGKAVLEIGPGHGILTSKLCGVARSVIAVEKDPLLYHELRRSLDFKNLRLINADFLEVRDELKEAEILIANIPYNLSSQVISWITENGKEAVLCLQKEFVGRLLAQPGTREYSKLSVVSALSLSITEIMDVQRGNFSPEPKVDSEVIYVKPRRNALNEQQYKVISALMQHKKKTVRRALIDARSGFGATRERMVEIAEKAGGGGSRVFMLSPEELLGLAERVIAAQKE